MAAVPPIQALEGPPWLRLLLRLRFGRKSERTGESADGAIGAVARCRGAGRKSVARMLAAIVSNDSCSIRRMQCDEFTRSGRPLPATDEPRSAAQQRTSPAQQLDCGQQDAAREHSCTTMAGCHLSTFAFQ